MTVTVSVTLPQFRTDARPLLEAAGTAERLGMAGVFIFDHLVPVGSPHRPVLEGAVSLGAVAAATSAMKVGTLVMRATLRPPEVTAGVAATAAAVASGRTVIGLGAGDRLSESEAERFGLELTDPAGRVQRLGETLRAVRRAIPGVEVWVGGRSQAVREMAADLADGWNAWGAAPEQFASETAEVRARADRPITVS
ncbi:MAG: LLM class flavin-dependent oxidoreductase, partial [Acidimicrobiia bacterium]